MRLYHSSNVIVPVPDTLHSRDFLDFGKGFYLTTLREQAVSYAQRYTRRGQEAWINTYEFTINPEDWEVKEFTSYDGEWLEFVSNCRAGLDTTNYDLIIGGIANDKVIRTLDRYFEGELSAEATLGLLKYEIPNNQYCIRSQEMLNNCLKHVESLQL